MSFWHSEYISLLEDISTETKKVGSVSDFLNAKDKRDYIILRHDVDRRPAKARALAEVEYKLGIRSTYYFRVSSKGTFPVSTIRHITALGHEVGYHYEDLSECEGNVARATMQFANNLAALRLITLCETVSMHGAPLSRFDNQRLTEAFDLTTYQLTGDAVSSVLPYKPIYLTDTGGNWLARSTNLRDYVGLGWPASALPQNRVAFRSFISTTREPLYISTHPERWSAGIAAYLYAKIFDLLVNGAKKSLSVLRASVKA